MSSDTFRQDKLKDFTVIRNAIFKDRTLSAKAVGVACKLLSLPPDWDYSVRGIVALFSDGESSIRNALSELEEHGYLHRERIRDHGKLGGCIYIITDSPKSEKPNVKNPVVVNRVVENHTQYNTKELNTKELNTNKRFIAPSIDEVREYIEEKGYSIDPERFVDYYTANGWMIGKSHMKDWKATVRNWERNNGNDTGASGRKPRGLRGTDRKGREDVEERVATGFIPMATDLSQVES
jgi:hypothetical protein